MLQHSVEFLVFVAAGPVHSERGDDAFEPETDDAATGEGFGQRPAAGRAREAAAD